MKEIIEAVNEINEAVNEIEGVQSEAVECVAGERDGHYEVHK